MQSNNQRIRGSKTEDMAKEFLYSIWIDNILYYASTHRTEYFCTYGEALAWEYLYLKKKHFKKDRVIAESRVSLYDDKGLWLAKNSEYAFRTREEAISSELNILLGKHPSIKVEEADADE